VLIVNRTRQIRSHATLVIRVRHHQQNIRFKSLVRPFHNVSRRRRRLRPPPHFPSARPSLPAENHQPSLHSTPFHSLNNCSKKEKIVPAPPRNSLAATPASSHPAPLYLQYVPRFPDSVFRCNHIAAPLFGCQQTEDSRSFPPGDLMPRVVALQNPQQSYALYVPTKYSRQRRWPIVYVFDPLARGPLALAQFQHAAEIHGYIVAVSNNSRNGPWQPRIRSRRSKWSAILSSALPWTANGFIFAGFSGGARVAAQARSALQMRSGSPVKRRWVFSRLITFSKNRSSPFSLPSVTPTSTTANWFRYRTRLKKPHFLTGCVFSMARTNGAPPVVIDEAFAWFRIQSVKSQREPGDDVFIAAQWSAAQARASALEKIRPTARRVARRSANRHDIRFAGGH